MFVILTQAHCTPLYIRLILRRLCCAKDDTRAHLVSLLSISRAFFGALPRSVRQSGYLPKKRGPGLCAPASRRVCPSRSASKEDAPALFVINDRQLRSCQEPVTKSEYI